MNIHTHSAGKPFKSHLAQTAMTWRVGQSSSEYIFPSFLSTSPCSRVLCWEIPLSLACFDLFAPEKCIHCLAACVRAFDNECNRLLRRLRYNLLWTTSTTVFYSLALCAKVACSARLENEFRVTPLNWVMHLQTRGFEIISATAFTGSPSGSPAWIFRLESFGKERNLKIVECVLLIL
jgi:hypothetical protein